MSKLELLLPQLKKVRTVNSSSLSGGGKGNLWGTVSALVLPQLCCVALGELLDVSVLRTLGMVLTGKNV